ncbi:hypothetical protein VRK_28890 [Vibrio sp. MEBiC08052]|nr:hypothetical protein VRK_28890 [Vibrio sp. MEBiC08052]
MLEKFFIFLKIFHKNDIRYSGIFRLESEKDRYKKGQPHQRLAFNREISINLAMQLTAVQ